MARGSELSVRDGILLLIRSEGRFLLVRRAEGVPFGGKWALVSGKIEAREEPKEAAIREAKEELGVALRPICKVWECLSIDGRFRLHWWTAELLASESDLAPDSREISELRWLRPEELDEVDGLLDAEERYLGKVLAELDP